MIIKNNIKYACEPCIKGHRVASCDHSDRPLVEIKRKGRPSTACFHCKELRLVRNVNPSGSCKCYSKKTETTCGCSEGKPCKCHTRRKRSQNKTSNTLESPKNWSAVTPTSIKDEDLDALLSPMSGIFNPIPNVTDEPQTLRTPVDQTTVLGGNTTGNSETSIYSSVDGSDYASGLSFYDLDENLRNQQSSLFNTSIGDIANYNLLGQGMDPNYNFILPEIKIDDINKKNQNNS